MVLTAGAQDKAVSTDATEALRVNPSIFQIQNPEEECYYSVTLNGLNTLFFFRVGALGLPSWLSGEESACRCKRQGFDPWSGKISHAAKQLSP